MQGKPTTHTRQLKALHTLTALVTSAGNLEKAFPHIAAAVARSTGFPCVLIERHSRGRDVMELVAQHGFVRPQLRSSREFPAATSLSWKAVRTRKPVVVIDPAFPVHPLLRRRRIRHFVSVPLRVQHTIVGALSVASTRPVITDRDFVRFLRTIGDVLGHLIERGNVEEDLHLSEQRYRLFFGSAFDAIVIVEPESGKILDVNPQASRLFGYSRKELLTRTIREVLSAETKPQADAAFMRLHRGGNVRNVRTLRVLRKEQTIVPVEMNARMTKAGEERTDILMFRNISDEIHAATNLRTSEDLLRLIVEETQDLFFYVQDANGVFTYVSPSVLKITGHSVEEWKDVYSKFLTPNPVNQMVGALRKETFRSGTAAPAYPCEIIHADGRMILLEINERPIIREGRVVGIQGVARDITDRKRLEEKLLESRDHLNRLIDQTPIAVLVFDAKGTAIDANAASLRLFGMQSKMAVVGRLNLFSTASVQDERIQKRISAAYAGEVVDVPPFTITPKEYASDFPFTAGERTVRAKLFPVFDRIGSLVNVVTMLEDVSDKRQLEEQLLQSQKMESIGLLAGGIAHDFNNILGAILGYASHLKTIKFEDQRVYEHLETIERSALRAAELTSQLLTFARGGSYASGPVDVHGLIEETARLLRGSFDKRISVLTELRAQACVVEGDASHLQQVLMNLCVNARDAMPEGGTLTIGTWLMQQPDRFLVSQQIDSKTPHIRIDITDTGVGIDKSIHARIFEPFFTTKEKGRGTGLGLATAYGIVEHHGGLVNFTSEVGVGTTFTVYLPVINRQVAPPRTESPRMPGGRETILIVDDERMIRELVKDILESKGYQVLTAPDGASAIELFQRRRSSIDLVILDMIMPGMSGIETMRKLKAIESEVKAILSSGFSEDERTREFIDLGVKLFLQKPYRTEDLSNAVRRVLDGGWHS